MTKEQLQNARAIYLLICTYVNELNELRLIAYSTPIASYKEAIGSAPGTNQSKTENFVLRITEYEEKIKETMQKYVEEKEKIASAIDSLQDLTERAILRMRYINGLTFKEISQNINYTRSRTYEIHDEALRKIVNP